MQVETSKEYDEFLEFIGSKITLQGWNKYRGGLDVKSKFFYLFLYNNHS